MSIAQLAPQLARIMPGVWNVRATNFPVWLRRERAVPRFTFELVSEQPLVLDEDLVYLDSDGAEKHLVVVSRWGDGGFVSRGKGLQRLFPSFWSVAGVSDDATVIVIRYESSKAAGEGIHLLVRDGHDVPELRTLIARNSGQFGLEPEDFASLSWLGAAG